jgi:hypothetical protein
MVGTLDRCWLFVYRTSVEAARAELPRGLAPVTHHDFAFWNVVVCHVRDMRPRGAPPALGISYWQVSYRLYVRLHAAGEPMPIDGLYFVRSDSDNPMIRLAGNRVTDFAFHRASIAVDDRQNDVYMRVRSREAPASVGLTRAVPPSLSAGSPFASLEEAAALLQYKPFGISVDAGETANVVAITRDEAAWHARLVRVASAHWGFFQRREVQLELCYEVDPIDYRWNRGRTYRVLHGLSDVP